MKSFNTKLLFGIFVLLAFISMGVFGLLSFNHVSHAAEAPMLNCPYTPNSYSICATTLNHIDKWQQFSSVTFSAMTLFSFLILGIILYSLASRNFLNQKQYFYNWKYYLYDKKLYKSPDRIIKWLSLLENSPSFLYVKT